jgi:polyisoprenoid-binding protein YceI
MQTLPTARAPYARPGSGAVAAGDVRTARATPRRRPALSTLAACLLAAPLPALAAAEVYRFDPVHTQIWFGADHQRFSHPLGRLRVKDGWFLFDDKDWSASRVDVSIDLASADMGDAKWNETVKGGAFLDVEHQPLARYVSRSVEKKDDTHGVIRGDLHFRGDTQPVDVEFTLNRIGEDPYLFKRKAGFSARAELSRSAFGMKRYAEVVGDRIELRLEIEGIRDRGAAATTQKGD